jgi:hypothetical protein
MTFCNFRRPYQAMNNQMPTAVWRAGMDRIEAAGASLGHPKSRGQQPTVEQKQQKKVAEMV